MKTFQFTVVGVGSGDDEASAWADARETLVQQLLDDGEYTTAELIEDDEDESE